MKAQAAGRLERLRNAAAENGIRTFLVRDTASIEWLTAFDGVFDDEQAHALLVTPHDAVLHTDSRYSGAARKAAQGEGVVAVDDARQGHGEWVADVFTARHASAPAGSPAPESIVLGIEDSMTLAAFRALEGALAKAPASPQLLETSGFVRSLRAVKEPSEVARMKAAQAITDAAFSYIVTYMKPGMTERQVQIELEDWMLRHGASGLAFSSIVACGANGASPHAIPGEAQLEAGQCVVMDFGARAHGYCSDMTRTVAVGHVTEEMETVYNTVLKAQLAGIAAAKAGVTGAAVDGAARQVIADAGYGPYFGHSFGHSVGVEIHENPNATPSNSKPLPAGAVISAEPGIYLPGKLGVRIEDVIVITEQGCQDITLAPKELLIL